MRNRFFNSGYSKRLASRPPEAHPFVVRVPCRCGGYLRVHGLHPGANEINAACGCGAEIRGVLTLGAKGEVLASRLRVETIE